MNFKQLHNKSIREAFTEFHNKNPQVFKKFETLALRAIENGREKLSAKLIINYIRWEVYMTTTDENFKLNDAFHSYYGRLFISLHPEHTEKFEIRKLRNEELGPYMINENGQLSFLKPLP